MNRNISIFNPSFKIIELKGDLGDFKCSSMKFDNCTQILLKKMDGLGNRFVEIKCGSAPGL